ncbi:flagellar capping protein [Paenibacillus sp. FSL R7-269]|uniref:flagellar filament capping protein FliD n=1 Tax=Paenibacillus sp. FSL R7-269 TaxID=1226755 RepID=UPI0003E1F742|nr:flagellar filament capping protein FliD [Paenibacillus sp. FSL R7-269]ETT49977.1 flagellar capping protein [Paenibacillus sp. FSL R7-269]
MVNRISGMVSGLDVDSLVKQMVNAKRIPLDKLTQEKQIMQWQRDNYREINSKLIDFSNSKLKIYNNSSQLNTQTAVVTGSVASLKAEATSDANGIPMKMSISSLAKPVSWQSNVLPNTGTSRTTSSSKLSALVGASTTDQAYKITINGSSLSFDKDLSIAEVISKINTDSKANVTATFDEVSGKFSLASKTFGAEGKLAISNSSSLLTLFGSNSSSYTPIAFQQAEISVVDINTNISKTLNFDSNNFKLNGVSITLLSTTSASESVTVSTQSDSTKALGTITSFIKDYNDLLNTLQTKVAEERYKDFTPLTDEQKQAMTDNDIELWEKKAKSGLLRNDEILKSTIASMRSEMTKRLGDLSSIGITTGQYYENGKLYINESKLKQALIDSPQKISSLFQGTSGTDGVFNQLITSVDKTLDKIVTKAGTSKFSSDLSLAYKTDSFMGKRLTDYNTRISAMQSRLTTMETNYYKKFTAMETAMNKYNSQSSSLSSYFAK